MIDNVTRLDGGTFQTIGSSSDEGGYLRVIKDFLVDRGLFETFDTLDEAVELENSKHDERKLGRLTLFEKESFAIGSLLNEIIRDEVVNADVHHAEEVIQFARENKMPMIQAAMHFAQNRQITIEPETQEILNVCATTAVNLLSGYEWSVRARHNVFDKPIIVRTGFIAFTYG